MKQILLYSKKIRIPVRVCKILIVRIVNPKFKPFHIKINPQKKQIFSFLKTINQLIILL